MKLNWIIFVTGWMSFRAVGSGLFLFWIFTENERSAPSEWIIPFVGDFFIGIIALFLVYHIIKKPSTILWGLLLSWNVIGLLDYRQSACNLYDISLTRSRKMFV